MNTRKCLQCGEHVIGRADKKFCDSYCRSQFHNEKLNRESDILRKVERILRKNRRILRMLASKSGIVISKRKLQELGFQFEYFTHRVKAKTGLTYYFCYDRGVLPIDDQKVAVVLEPATLEKQAG